jgi:hypothetical protein
MELPTLFEQMLVIAKWFRLDSGPLLAEDVS